MATKKEFNDLVRCKSAIIKAVCDVGDGMSANVVLAALLETMVDAAIVIAGRDRAIDTICNGVNAALLVSTARKAK